jgi:Domain of unknown function (DUF6249)
MNRTFTPAPTAVARPLVRRLVLGTAFFLGLAVAFVPRPQAVNAQETKSPPAAAPAAPKSPSKSVSITDGRGAEIKIDVSDSPRVTDKAESAPGARTDSATPAEGADARQRGAKPRRQARVIIDGIGGDREFDSVETFVHDEPALAGMVVAIVFVVFMAPVLAIALVLWYRMRKARMLNETMLMLAEKGVVPPSEAFDALAGDKLDAFAEGRQSAAMAPYYDRAKQVRRRAAWSDLRKGVLMGGFGLALSVYSLLEDREANGLGLVLLFVGLGFVALWWFEQRHLAPADGPPRDAAPGPVSGAAPGSTPPA